MNKLQKSLHLLAISLFSVFFLLSFNLKLQAAKETETEIEEVIETKEKFDPEKFLEELRKEVERRDKLTKEEHEALIKTLEDAKFDERLGELKSSERSKIRTEIQNLISLASKEISLPEKLENLIKQLDDVKNLLPSEIEELIKDIEETVEKVLREVIVKRYEKLLKQLFDHPNITKENFSEKQIERIKNLQKKLKKEEKEEPSEEIQIKVPELLKQIEDLSPKEQDLLIKKLKEKGFIKEERIIPPQPSILRSTPPRPTYIGPRGPVRDLPGVGWDMPLRKPVERIRPPERSDRERYPYRKGRE